MNPSQFTQALIEAAKAEDWDRVDTELVPQLRLMDGNKMADELLKFVGDKNPDVRDVAATSFSGLEGLSQETEGRVAEEMFKMASKDEERYTAGRAMTYLLTLKDKPEFEGRVSKTLSEFKLRATREGWTADLKEAIPALVEVL